MKHSSHDNGAEEAPYIEPATCIVTVHQYVRLHIHACCKRLIIVKLVSSLVYKFMLDAICLLQNRIARQRRLEMKRTPC